MCKQFSDCNDTMARFIQELLDYNSSILTLGYNITQAALIIDIWKTSFLIDIILFTV